MTEPWLDGQFLIAMPGMRDSRFERTVVYLCAHSSEGAMGLVINRSQEMVFPDLLVQLGLMDEHEAIKLPAKARDFMVRDGGPVERSRGFVLHTGDYQAESSLEVTPEISLTATVDILRAISRGGGPTRALMALGYSGWGPGQLETEIADNGWLTCPATSEVMFSPDMTQIYPRALALLGIDNVNLSHYAGRA
ncbi:YqgE/AlgH family protein [Roseibium sp.]|uniref:YqgE/AlgH family protein n=1 Tax=Roseibium sp. TaxID=1936156 RepID=UPI003D0EC99D